MIVRKRILHLLSLLVGLVGLVVCIVAIVGIWSVSGRVNRATGNVFGTIDDSLVAVEQRIAQTRDRIQALKITTEDIEQSVANWAKTEARDRLTSRVAVEEDSKRLLSGLEQTDHWLELTQSSVQLVQRALEVGNSLSVSVQLERVDRLLEELAAIRAKLKEVIEPVDRICKWSSAAAEDGPGEEGLNQVVQLAVRVIATLSSIDSRLENLSARLIEMRTKTRVAKTKATRWIRITAIGITLLIGWLASGQASLCFLGWKGLRRW